MRTFMVYMNVQKYGPTLLFLCATLPFALVTLAVTSRKALTDGLARVFVVFGRVPMFFYILQWIWAHLSDMTVALLYGKPLTFVFQTPFDVSGRRRWAGRAR
ncbi:MAG TPA: hypothetical protein VE869_05570 [Gemmatimonas sp.]|nr:hypothetical protein [Gemmatimonas sp.]